MGASTLQELLDRVEIRELTARYNNAIDNGDVEGFIDCFIPDGIFYTTADVQLKGREQIRSFGSVLGYGCIHMTMDAIVTVDGDKARQSCTMLVAKRQKDKQDVSIVTTGRYDDHLVRTAEGWLFASRKGDCDVELNLVVDRLSRLI